jgi:hypothetical protein
MTMRLAVVTLPTKDSDSGACPESPGMSTTSMRISVGGDGFIGT